MQDFIWGRGAHAKHVNIGDEVISGDLKGKPRPDLSIAGGADIPQVRLYKTEYEYNAVVFDLLGPSLESLFNFYGRHSTVSR